MLGVSNTSYNNMLSRNDTACTRYKQAYQVMHNTIEEYYYQDKEPIHRLETACAAIPNIVNIDVC